MNWSDLKKKVRQNKGVRKLRETWDENPAIIIGAAIAATLAVSKLITALTEAKNSRTWQKEVNRRDRNSRRKS